MERIKRSDDGLLKHWENFIAAIKSSKQSDLNCPVATGAHIATVCQLGNIAFRSQKKIFWDKEKMQLTDKRLNKEYLFAKYHNGYTLPKV